MNPSGEPITPRGRGRGMWKQHPESHKELRRPQSESRVGIAGNNATAAVSERGAEDNISKTSKLSADAKEFYPKGYQQSMQNQDCCNSSQFDENQLQGGGDGQTHSVTKANNDRITTSHLIDVMHHLTLNPGRFDALINPMADSFRTWLADKEKIHFIVNAIVEQSIDEPNFRYNGARLCSFLNNEFTTQKSSFRNCLLTRCKEEHVRMPNHIHTDPKRLHGFVMFMAELYMQLELTKGCGTRIAVLGTGLIEALNLLLTYPLAENIKCACQVLKLTGSQLDAQEPMNMNQIMQTLLRISSSINEADPSSSRLINSVLELRQSRWGEATAMSSNSSTNQSFTSYPQDGPVFYGPDGQIMTPEESQFLQESAAKIPDTEDYDEYGDENWEGDNEMDEEIEAAYEQFLMGKTQAQNADKCNG